MAVPVIYLVIIFAYSLLFLGLWKEDEIIIILSSFLLFSIPVYTFINGIDIFAHNNFLVIMFSAVTFAVAGYCGLRASLEIINRNYGG